MFKCIQMLKNKNSYMKNLEHQRDKYQELYEEMKDIREKEKVNAEERVYEFKRLNSKLEEQNCSLLQTNQELIDWIYKIINECKIMKVNNENTVTIPIYERDITPMYSATNEGEVSRPFCDPQEEVIIPTIRFVKFK